ncbi:hypothetical protein [Parasedimentitalea denitrificans]|nr:hypothetical protein [Sedimentitalea sp. CY04]
MLKIVLTTLAIGVPTIASADKAELWEKADGCFKVGDYGCAYNTGIELFKAGHIAVGFDHRTTDSMTYLQMAFVERAARSSAGDVANMTGETVRTLGKNPNRLPFLFGFALLSNMDVCNASNCGSDEKIVSLYCQIQGEIPPPSWRKLHDLPPLTDVGRNYFERVMKHTPECTGA